jgi:predicted porin
VQPVDPWKLGMGTASSTISTAARPDGLARNDNAIIYTSPVIGKVTVKAQYAAGETGTAYVHARDSKGVLVSYNDGKLLAGAVYNTHANATDAGNDRTMTIGASYKFAQVEPAFLYQVGKWEGSRTLAAPSLPSTFFSRDYTSFMVGATYRVAGTAGRFIGTFKRYNDKTVRNYDADQLTVGYKYNLSKRTELYTAVSRMANKNNAAFAVVDATTTYGPVNPGKNPSTMFAGITHNF